MVVTHLSGVDVEFPYEPYECQVAYMTKVIQALDLKCDAALESPTGTGKTLSLLCASLAWLQKQKMTLMPSFQDAMAMANESNVNSRYRLLPKIYYCSRTHSQLAQVVRELNKTVYKIFPTSVLASRDQLCIHPKVQKERDNRIKSSMCRAMTRARTCHFYNEWDKCKPDQLNTIYRQESGDVMDIEDLVDAAKASKHCPYFRTRQMQESAELVLLPYNYLISPELRRIHKVDLKGSVVIFDEAHNLEGVCEETISVELSTTDVALCIKEMKKAIELRQEETELIRAEMIGFGNNMGKEQKKGKEEFEIGTAAIVLSMLFELEKAIDAAYDDSKQVSKSFHDFPGKVFQGEYMLTMLEKAEFTADKASEIIDLLGQISDYLQAKTEGDGAALKTENGAAVHKLIGFLGTIYSGQAENAANAVEKQMVQGYAQLKPEVLAKDFKLYMVKEKEQKKKGEEESTKITMKYWCFSAKLAMKLLKDKGVRSIIVTSGTLSPLKSFMENLGLDFGCSLENTHAAKSNQIIAGIIRRGPREKFCGVHAKTGELLNGNYNNRSNADYHQSVGLAMLHLAKIVPQGILVFFSSYTLMDVIIKALKTKGIGRMTPIWDELEKLKTLVIEPRSKEQLAECRLTFSKSVRQGTGAIFMAVCRGKVSEGIDFADADSRAVLIVGIPYPPLVDPRVKLKRMYLDDQRQENNKTQSSNTWYEMEGYRAVNQAIGRVLRHINDFGVVALLDTRFSNVAETNFPSWMRPSIKQCNQFEDFETQTVTFFRERGVEIEQSRVKMMERPTERTTTKPGNKRKRILVQDENEMNFENAGADVIPLTKRGPTITSIENIDQEEIRPTSDNDVVCLSANFGTVSAPKTANPERKKIRLARNVNFNEAPSNSQPAERNAPPVLPEKYQNLLEIDNAALVKLCKEHNNCGHEIKAILNEFRFQSVPFDVTMGKFEKLLLPQSLDVFIAVMKFFGNQHRAQMIPIALKYIK